MVKYRSRITFPVMFDMATDAFLTKKLTLINWLQAFVTRQSREPISSYPFVFSGNLEEVSFAIS
jgi:hypothetical protein